MSDCAVIVIPSKVLLHPGEAVHGAREAAAKAEADAALAVQLMTNTAVTGATYDIDGGQQLVEG